jgi:2-oxoglutarate ferredoxin oxidoreductase subunit delta
MAKAVKSVVRIIVDVEKCKACELCVAFCAKGYMRLSTAMNRRGFHIAECSDPENCTACAACAVMCPETAIEIIREEAEK